ncbi:MAG: hypothetical protein Nk1A_8500 [Endomicrobiia bacterium]|nr:MAG: hypothetical protein Nk1A_8500 [Endomicrobiia bacterium]
MAWFYLKGEEAINQMASYYETQIKEYSKNNYDKGYEDGKNGVTHRVVTKPKTKDNELGKINYIPKNPALNN